MAVTSYLSTGTCADDATVGTVVWAQDEFGTTLAGTEASSDNNVFAGVSPSTSIGTSHYLKCTNFGFTSGDIPSGSTINGFEVEVRQHRTAGPTIIATAVKFVKGGSVVGNDIGIAGDWATSETAVVYGSSTELGGQSWTQSDVTASNFGCVISITWNASRLVAGFTHRVDQVRIRVYYTVPGNPTLTGVASMTGVVSITF